MRSANKNKNTCQSKVKTCSDSYSGFLTNERKEKRQYSLKNKMTKPVSRFEVDGKHKFQNLKHVFNLQKEIKREESPSKDVRFKGKTCRELIKKIRKNYKNKRKNKMEKKSKYISKRSKTKYMDLNRSGSIPSEINSKIRFNSR